MGLGLTEYLLEEKIKKYAGIGSGVLTTASIFGGDVSGLSSALTIALGAVTTAKLAAGAATGAALGSDVIVSSTGLGIPVAAPTGVAATDTATLTAAIAANPGTCLLLKAGTYVVSGNSIALNQAGTTMQGANGNIYRAGNTTIQLTSQSAGANVWAVNCNTSATGCIGIKFDGNGTTIGSGNYWSGLINVAANDVLLAGNSVSNTARTGVYANGATTAINRLRLMNNNFTNIGTAGAGTGGSCVMFDGGCNDCKVVTNYAVAPLTSNFIKLQGATTICLGNLIEGNTIDYTANATGAYDTTNQALAIELFNGAYATRCVANTVYGPTASPTSAHVWGISCGDARFSTIVANTIIGAASNATAIGLGIEIAECPTLTVVGNTVQNCATGMNATNQNPMPSHGMTISANVLWNCPTNGFTSDSGPAGIDFTNNLLVDCGRFLFLNTTNHISRQINIHSNRFFIKDQTATDTDSSGIIYAIYVLGTATTDVIPVDIFDNYFGPWPGGTSTHGFRCVNVNTCTGGVIRNNRFDGARPSDGAANGDRAFIITPGWGWTVKGNYARNFVTSFGSQQTPHPGEAYDNDIDTLAFSSITPTAAAGANNGTTPPAPVVATGSATRSGTLTFGSGTTPAAGDQVDVAFTWQLFSATGGAVHLTPLNAATQALGLYVTGFSATGFSINTANAPTASQANTVYSVAWTVIKP